MQFVVPQFIEREAKIIGPLTFKQFVFVGTAGGICLFLFFIVPLSLFVIISVFLLGGASALAFIKIGKEPLPVIIRNLFTYSLNPKVFLWKRDFSSSKSTFTKKVEALPIEKRSEVPEGESLKVSGSSQLGRLSTRIETKNK